MFLIRLDYYPDNKFSLSLAIYTKNTFFITALLGSNDLQRDTSIILSNEIGDKIVSASGAIVPVRDGLRKGRCPC